MTRFIYLFSMLCLALVSYGQGIKGRIIDENGKPLPFASIYIKEKGTGTSSNLEGKFEMPISSGDYTISFQFSVLHN